MARLANLVDLTKNLDSEGKLNWQAPAGKWTVLRFGHVECKPMLPAVCVAPIYGKKRIVAESFTNIDIKWNEPPFRADITPHLVSGANAISIKVTNTWFNRLAYDAALPEAQRKTWTIRAPAANSPLETSGLVGPARLQLGRIVELPR